MMKVGFLTARASRLLKKNWYYHAHVQRFYDFVVPRGASILHLHDAALLPVGQTFDYILLSDVLMETDDIQQLFQALLPLCHRGTRVVIVSYSYLWEPIVWFAQIIGVRRPTPHTHWISQSDRIHLLELAGFQVIGSWRFMLVPLSMPVISTVCNRILALLPGINRLCLHESIVARPLLSDERLTRSTVSVIIPCRNERGNIERAVRRIPSMGAHTEIIFVEGNSHDGTLAEIARVKAQYPDKDISWYVQDGTGKGDAVRKGFAHARGDILMILDGDLTVPPEELPKFFNALVANKADFINGSRLVYGMESQAMRFLNFMANWFFARLFSWILGNRIKDTLCGTKVLWRKDYEKIVKNRAFFGEFDPFGDFDLLFGAAKLNLTIIDMPVHYKSRQYGTTQIRRFYHGWMLLKMSCIGIRKFKLR